MAPVKIDMLIDVAVQAGDYTFEVHPGGKLWIRNKEGEGVELGYETVEKMFKKLFEENFII